MIDFFFDYILGPIIGVVLVFLVFLLIVLGIALYQALTEPGRPEFCLIKNEWTCSKEELHVTQSMIMSGKVLVPIRNRRIQCVQWTHK